MNPSICIAAEADAYAMAPYMRVRDVEEIRASSGNTPTQALLNGVDAGNAFTAFDKAGPVAMFGCAPYMGDMGCPWFLATDRLPAYSRFFLKQSRKFVDQWEREYAVLVNYVDCRNIDSLKYLQALGFEFSKFIPNYGAGKKPFLRFHKVSRYV